MQLAKRVWDFVTSQDLLHDGDRLVVAVSGGPDSLCLLEVLHSLASRHRLTLHVAHLNHGLRPEAAEDAAFVRAQAEARGLSCFSATADVAAAAQVAHQSIETAARAQRYAFLAAVAGHTGAGQVAVAHTADDQAETVLMHLLRGAGLRGLQGMLPTRPLGKNLNGHWVTTHSSGQSVTLNPLPQTADPLRLALIRPLLFATRAEVLAYCAARSLRPRLDSSNADPRFLRNRVRHELLPALERYNPNIRAGLARSAAAAAGDYALWRKAAGDSWAAAAVAAGAGQVAFDRERWGRLVPAERRALLRLAVEKLSPDGEVGFAALEAAEQFSREATPGRACQLAAGLRLRVEAKRVVVLAARAVPAATAAPQLVEGALAAGWGLEATPLGGEGWSRAEITAAPRWTAFVDSERLPAALRLRARRRGERFQPLGLGGHSVLLSDFFVDQKVPAEQREHWPLLTSGDEVVWVVGLRLDERFKVTPSTRHVTRLALISADEDGRLD
jgi:tRNA(Ile)-lysidine synthase